MEGLCVQESRQLYGFPGDAGMATGMCLRSRVKVREAKSRIRLITHSLCDKGEAHGHSAWCPRESVAPANTCSSCCSVDTDVFGKHWKPLCVCGAVPPKIPLGMRWVWQICEAELYFISAPQGTHMCTFVSLERSTHRV